MMVEEPSKDYNSSYFVVEMSDTLPLGRMFVYYILYVERNMMSRRMRKWKKFPYVS